MSRLLRNSFITLLLCAIAVAVFSTHIKAGAIQTQRDQIFVAILVNVTPSPIAYEPPPAQSVARPIIARFSVRARGSRASVDSTVLSDTSYLVAAAPTPTAQADVKVEAEVSPNPLATLLYSNTTGVTLSGVAGTTVVQPCIYTVTVDTTITSWTLREGLASDFAAGFPGGDAANNSYISTQTPQPTATPFIVYPTAWTVLAPGGGMQTYCVDLDVTIPGSVPGGAYSTNAVYTLYY